MNITGLGGLLIGAVAFLSFILAVVTFVSTRRSKRDDQKIATRINEFTILEGTIETLRENLKEAQAEAEALHGELAAARGEIRKLQSEITSALMNVAILSDHIRDHVPTDVPFPRLRPIGRNGA